MRLVPAIFLACATLLASQQAAFGAGRQPRQHHTPKDTLLAGTILLKRTDLGSGWTARSGQSISNQPCGILHDLQPNESTLTETGQAITPVFSHGIEEAVSQSVRVFATNPQVETAWQRTATKQLVICTEQQVESASGMGSPVSVTNWSMLQFPHNARHVYGLRITATARIGKNETWKNPTKLYYDLILLADGRAMTKIVFSALGHPFPNGYERQLEQAVAHTLHSP